MTGPDLKARLAEFIERVWSRGDLAAIDDLVADEYVVRHDPGDPWDGKTLTREGFRDRVCRSRKPFPDQRFTLLELLEDDGRVVATWSWEATHRGDIPDFPATGRRIAMTGATLYDFDARGRVAGHWQIADRLGVWRQLMAARGG